MSSYTKLKKHIDMWGLLDVVNDINFYLDVGGDDNIILREQPSISDVVSVVNELDEIRNKLIDTEMNEVGGVYDDDR